MNKPALNLELLRQASAMLDQVATSFDTVLCAIDGRLASLDAGNDWQPHPELASAQLRRLAAPAGAPYRMVEVRALAGAQAGHVQLSHATDMHVLSGQVAIGRAGAAAPECYATGSCARFTAKEAHSFEVLQDTHNLLIFHIPQP